MDEEYLAKIAYHIVENLSLELDVRKIKIFIGNNSKFCDHDFKLFDSVPQVRNYYLNWVKKNWKE